MVYLPEPVFQKILGYSHDLSLKQRHRDYLGKSLKVIKFSGKYGQYGHGLSPVEIALIYSRALSEEGESSQRISLVASTLYAIRVITN